MMQFDVDIEAVESTAYDLKNIAQNIEEQTKRITEISGRVQEAMTSEYLSIFMSASDSLNKEIKNTAEDVEYISAALIKFTDDLRKLEKELGNMMIF